MTSLSTYDFSTLYTTLPHNLLKEKLLYLFERAYKKFYKNEGTLCLAACNDKIAFFTFTDHRGYKLGLVRIYVTPNRPFWIKLTSDLVISYTLSDELLVIPWVQIVLPLYPICFFILLYLHLPMPSLQ